MQGTRVKPLYLDTIYYQNKRARNIASPTISEASSFTQQFCNISALKAPIIVSTSDHILNHGLTLGVPLLILFLTAIFLILHIWRNVIELDTDQSIMAEMYEKVSILKYHLSHAETTLKEAAKFKTSPSNLTNALNSNAANTDQVSQFFDTAKSGICSRHHIVACGNDIFQQVNGSSSSMVEFKERTENVLKFHQCKVLILSMALRLNYTNVTFSDKTLNEIVAIFLANVSRFMTGFPLLLTTKHHIHSMYNVTITLPPKIPNSTLIDIQPPTFRKGFENITQEIEATLNAITSNSIEFNMKKNYGVISCLILSGLIISAVSCYMGWKITRHLRWMHLGKKDTLFDVQVKYQNIYVEKQKSEDLLNQMLPKSVAVKLIAGQTVNPDTFEEVTVYFSDIVGFNDIAITASPIQIVNFLNSLYG